MFLFVVYALYGAFKVFIFEGEVEDVVLEDVCEERLHVVVCGYLAVDTVVSLF